MSLDKIKAGDQLTTSKDLLIDNIAKLKELFPEIVTEGKIDFNVLQEVLGNEVEQGEEYYRFTWAGKAQAREKADERNIEDQLTNNVTKFLLELGQGFAFIGRQVHFEIGGSDFYADLLFYHTKLHCYVVVELKARTFEPGDASQLNFYVNLINDKLKTESDNNTIGLLLCKGKSEIIAEYSLKGYSNPIGVTDYQLSKAIPDELKSSLPQIEDIENELKDIE